MLRDHYPSLTYISCMFLKRLYMLVTLLAIASMTMAAKVLHVEYYNNGQKKLELTKVKHGLVRIDQYYEDGVLRETGFLKRGKSHGKWMSYNRIGQQVATAYYYENVRLGSWTIYNQNTGESMAITFQEGMPSSYRSYGRDGGLISNGSLR